MASIFADIDLLNDAYCQACEWDVSSFSVTDCRVILVNGVLFAVVPNPAVHFPPAVAIVHSYFQHTPLISI
jgi:hypothetical protein